MTSAFFGLDIATRALRANQTLVDITNQNLANANTPGYSRQSAVMATPRRTRSPSSARAASRPLGTGVEVTSISRARDTFADYQFRNQLTAQGRWDAQQDALRRSRRLSTSRRRAASARSDQVLGLLGRGCQ